MAFLVLLNTVHQDGLNASNSIARLIPGINNKFGDSLNT
jgi:hypothetical protein